MADPVIAVLGPTAAGKSDLALRLARDLGGEIINADSMQLYRGMDIGTAKLTMAQRQGIPHHLLDVWDVRYPANVAEYQAMARDAIAGVTARGRVPILVGGSGLYLRAALDDLNFPGTDPAVRGRLEAELAARGPAELHKRLAGCDPDAAAGILPSNGRGSSARWKSSSCPGSSSRRRCRRMSRCTRRLQIGLRVSRGELDRRIAARWTGCGRPGWWTRSAAWSGPAARGPDGLPGARLRPGAAVPRGGVGRGRGARADGPGDPAVRPPPGVVVPPRPAGDLAGRGSRGGPAGPGTGYHRPMQFAKGHGTENDFVILPDPGGQRELTAAFTARLCDRRAGIGADGVLRVVRASAGPAPDQAGRAEWFMDYRNADGSIAEMCGNGLRVFARYLLEHGLPRARRSRSRPGPAPGRSGPSRMAGSPWTWAGQRARRRSDRYWWRGP